MALSMDEQRILAEIEQHLARAEPALAARLASFGRSQAGLPQPARTRVLAPLAAMVVLVIVAVVMYTLISVRGMPQRGMARPAAHSHPAMTAPAMTAPPAHASPPAPLP